MDWCDSMRFGSADDTGPSKFVYACWSAAALAWLITNQQDAAGLVLFDDKVRLRLPAKGGAGHLRNLIHELEQAEPAAATGIGRSLTEASEAIGRRGMVVLFSDLMDDPKEIARGLRQLRHRGHEVLLFHILAADEVNFPFQRLTRFQGLEIDARLTADPVALRNAYLAEVEAFRRKLRRICLANRIDLVEVNTSESLGVVLAAYLARRAARRRA